MPYVMEIAADPVPLNDDDQAKHLIDLVRGRAPMRFLKRFDPEANGGLGEVVMTNDLTQAMLFQSVGDVLSLWNTQSATVPFRDDGKPNKPMTAFTISPRQVTAHRTGFV
jgi:hypothetical protein